jgi:hypothetical protein
MKARTLFLLAVGVAVLALERRRGLRRRVQPDAEHGLRNAAVAALAATAANVVEGPIVTRVSQAVERRRWGLV